MSDEVSELRATAPRADRSALVAAVAAFALLFGVLVTGLSVWRPTSANWTVLGLVGLAWLVFGLAVRAVLRLPVVPSVRLILVGAVLLQLAAVAFPPVSTNDFYRYAWDGRVQAAGIDPYRYAPTDDALADLRTPWLFPSECQDQVPVCTRMNHPTDPTIYPPVAEGAFLALHMVTSPFGEDNGRTKPLQVFAALLALGTALILLKVLRRRGDPRWVVLWAWCPTVVLEAGNNAHVDVLGALLVAAGFGAVLARHHVRAGVLLGAAVATKLLPLLVLPALVARLPRPGDDAATWTHWARRMAVIGASAGGLIAVVYLPHLLAVGDKVLGFLGGYLSEEGYDGGARFPLLQLVLPKDAATYAGVAILLVATALVLLRGDPERPWRGAMVLTGLAFAVAAPTYPWYPVLLVVLVALDGRWEWLAVAAAAYPGYFTRALDIPIAATQQISYGLALVFVILVTVARSKDDDSLLSIRGRFARRGDESPSGGLHERGR